MSSRNVVVRRKTASTGSRRSWPPWNTDQLDWDLQALLATVTVIKDPAKRAWQAGRVIELHTLLSDVRTEAVQELQQRGKSLSEIAWLLGVTRGRVWQLGQPRNRKPHKPPGPQRRSP